MVDGLIKVPGYNNPNRVGDVIFVHGLGGDAITTWQPKTQKQPRFRLPRQEPHQEKNNNADYWLTWLGQEYPDLGIWSLDYEAEPSKWRGSSMPLSDRAINSLRVLQADRIGDRPILFITHSMGGLLVKQMLRHGWDYGDPKLKAIVEQIKGIVFLSTPHSGSNLANFVNYLRVLRPTISVRELEDNSAQLRELNLAYRNHPEISEIPIQIYYEKKPTAGIVVVDEASADLGLRGVIPMPMDDDHLTICTPASPEAPIYKLVSQFIEEHLLLPSQQGVPTLLIQGWTYEKSAERPTAELDWSSHFKKEPSYQVPDASLWETQFLPELRHIRDGWKKVYEHRAIILRGQLSLTAMLGIGSVFPSVGRYHLEYEQSTNNVLQTWRSQAAPSPLKFKVLDAVGNDGDEMLVVFSVTGNARPQVDAWLSKTGLMFDSFVHLEPETGASPTAIESDADAVALAFDAKKMLLHYRQQFKASKFHLILYCPAAFSLFLGQQLNALGQVVAYDWNRDQGEYVETLRLSV